MKKTQRGWSLTVRFNRTGLYFYHFLIDGRRFACGDFRRGTFDERLQSWQITVYDERFETPEWFKGGIMYQIFPDRFYKSGDLPIGNEKVMRKDWGGLPSFRANQHGKVMNNDFFGGNLKGVEAKLDYLKELNVSVIYFNPIFEAFSNHRYDTGDYLKIDGLLGSVEDFDELVSEAKKRGIRIILDGVFNHTGDDSRYFNRYGRYKDEIGAYQSPDSPYSDWFHFRHFPSDYDSWWGIETLPAVNERSPSYQNFIFGERGVLKTWLRHGIGGYRLDVADELPDFFLQKLRDSVKEENPDAVIIGEVWEDASNKIAYDTRRQYLQGYELDSVMNYPLKDAIIGFLLSGNTTQLRETIAMLIDHYPKQTLDCLMNILGTHDTPRILTVLGGKICYNKEQMAVTSLTEEEKAKAKEKLKMAVTLQFTLPGIPCIYYGDENGMEGYSDPFCRRCFDWERLDEDLEAFYRKIGSVRERNVSVLKDGNYREIFADRSCLIYERRKNDDSVCVYVNNSSNEYNLSCDGVYIEALSGNRFADRLKIPAFGYGILMRVE
ncbi:MAG: glycoside hydrolase family 13 protein [Candidatus Gallimonas sp.]